MQDGRRVAVFQIAIAPSQNVPVLKTIRSEKINLILFSVNLFMQIVSYFF